MKLKESIRRSGLVVVATMALVMSVTPPASADSDWVNGLWFGSYDNHTYFDFGVPSHIWPVGDGGTPPNLTVGGARLEMGRNATVSATNCVISMWQTLDTAGSNTWETPHQTSNCMNTIRQRDEVHYYATDLWRTSATAARGSFCVYLYYNGSSTPGWHRCETGVWEFL